MYVFFCFFFSLLFCFGLRKSETVLSYGKVLFVTYLFWDL